MGIKTVLRVPTTISPSSRIAILQSLVPIALVRATDQLDSFTARLSDALLKLSEQSVRPAEAALAFNSFNDLREGSHLFQRTVSDRLTALLRNEIRLVEKGGQRKPEHEEYDLSLVTFEEMENKVLLGNVSQTLERDIAEILGALNLRIGHLLGRGEMQPTENPFRPHIFLQAIYDAWCLIDEDTDSRRVVLRLLGPELFLDLAPVLQELNAALVEQGILPDLTEAYRLKKAQNKIGLPPARTKDDESRYNKIRRLLLASKDARPGGGDDLAVPDLFSANSDGDPAPHTISVRVGPRLFSHLNSLQKQLDQIEANSDAFPESAAVLRRVKETVPPGTLTAIDENTIELLAKMFDYIFQQKDIPADIRQLIGQLQIPLLKAALIDKKFFVKEDHPARLLVDTLAKSAVAWDQQKGKEDPLYKMIEQIVKRVQQDFDQQMGLFSDVVSNLETFLAEEEKSSEDALAEPIAEAMRMERMQLARQAAENDVSQRIETGEVAGFVEVFLETQWTRILTLAHSVKEQKPEVLVKATKAMDDLIWSIKPKSSPEERKDLIARLPAILSMVNAWLNAIKWDDPERVLFFSNLAERHAAIVRIQTELSPRHQVEIAVNIAQKASERKMSKQNKELQQKPRDKYARLVDDIEQGQWVEFARNNGSAARFRLTWISPARTSFIFTNRQGKDPFTFTADELAQTLRDRKATVVQQESVIDRALNAVLDDQAA